MSKRILIACEESQVVTKAMREQGQKAYSCDLMKPSGNCSKWHIQCDVREILDDDWNMMIAFPPCTHLAISGARWFSHKKRKQRKAIEFFMTLVNAPIPKIAIENPVGIMSSVWRRPDQVIQPWMFGHGEQKRTCLWLKNMPKLRSTNKVKGREQRIWKMGPSQYRSIERSKTYSGIAQAMAVQWGKPDKFGFIY